MPGNSKQQFLKFLKTIAGEPLFYLSLYVLMIPTFGVIYDLSKPGSFYAPYAKYEPGALADRRRMIASISKAVWKYAKTPHLEALTTVRLNNFDVTQVDVDESGNLKVSATILYSGIRPHLPHEKFDGGVVQASAALAFSIDHNSMPACNDGFDCLESKATHPVHPIAIKIIREPFPPNIGEALQNAETTSASDGEGITIWSADQIFEDIRDLSEYKNDIGYSGSEYGISLGEDGDRAMAAYIAGCNGDPTQLSGSLERMTYFSATTITTAGFGDIVPLTGTARVLVGLESVFGWSLAGLFLNAVTRRKLI